MSIILHDSLKRPTDQKRDQLKWAEKASGLVVQNIGIWLTITPNYLGTLNNIPEYKYDIT